LLTIKPFLEIDMNRFKCHATANDAMQTHQRPLTIQLMAAPENSALVSEPEFICYESTGLPAPYAVLACELAAVHTNWPDWCQGLDATDFEPSKVAHEVKRLKGGVEACDQLMGRVDGQLIQLNTFAEHLKSAFTASVSDPATLASLPKRLANELRATGLAYDAPSHLCGWSTLLMGALEQLQHMRRLCHSERAEHTEALERIVMSSQILGIAQIGTLELVKCLEDPQNKAAQTYTGRRALLHLKQHMQDPLTKSWYWLLDESGESDEDENKSRMN